MFGDVDELKYGPHLKTVRLKRRSGQSFGFALRGGREHKIGFFVTQVQPGSESERQGLSIGDQVIRINGLPVEEALHKEMLNMIRSKTQVTLKVRTGGMQPFYECSNQDLPWQPMRGMGHHTSSSWNALPMAQTNGGPSLEVARVTLSSNGKGTFGCSVCEGPAHKRGIYIQSMDEGSVARMAGIKPGDQILQCNGRDFTSVHFYDAVRLLKESATLNLVVAKGAGADFISPGESSGYNSAASSINGDHSPVQNDKKRLSVVREEIIDIVDERRGLVVGSVTVDCRKSWNDVENGRDRNELNAAKSRRNSGHLVEEEKKLQEERHRIEEAQRKLQQEAEKLALERRRLEETRQRLLNGSMQPLNKGNQVAPPPPAASSNKQDAVVNERSSSIHCAGSAASGAQASSALNNRIVRDPLHQKHEQLMEEFKRAHRKMFATVKGPKIGTDVVDRWRCTGRDPVQVSTCREGAAIKHVKHVLVRNCISAPLPPPPPPPLPPGAQERNTGSRSILPVPALSTVDRTDSTAVTYQHQAADMEDDNSQMDQVVLRQKAEETSEKRGASAPAGSTVRISIGTYPSQQQRPQPAKLDFLPARPNSEMKIGGQPVDSARVKNLLQTELSQTLSRARLRQRLPDAELPGDQDASNNPSGQADESTQKAENHRTSVMVREMNHLSVDDKRTCLLMELKSRNEAGSQSGTASTKKLAATGRASTVAAPVSLLTSPVKTTANNSSSNNNKSVASAAASHCSTVVISSTPREEILIERESWAKNHVRFSSARKPAPEIQARMATLSNQSADAGTAGHVTHNGHSDDKSTISRSDDNKVTIQVSTYVAGRPNLTSGGILKTAGSSISKATGGSRSISFGKT